MRSRGLTCGSVRLAARCSSLGVAGPPARTRRECSSMFVISDPGDSGSKPARNGLQCALCSTVQPVYLRRGRE